MKITSDNIFNHFELMIELRARCAAHYRSLHGDFVDFGSDKIPFNAELHITKITIVDDRVKGLMVAYDYSDGWEDSEAEFKLTINKEPDTPWG